MESNTLLRAAFDALPQPVLVVTNDGRGVFANRALLEFLGFPPDRREQLTLDEFWPAYVPGVAPVEEYTSEFQLQDGRVYTVKLSQRAVDGGAQLISVLAGQREDEDAINFHSQRLETLGVLAGGIAHDFNNMLTGIMGHVTYLKSILPRAGNHLESLRAVEDGARRAAVMIQQILGFSRLESSEQNQPVDLNQIVTGTCTLLRRAISPQFVLDVVVPAEPFLVRGVEARLAQVVVNLVINARDALDQRGTIRVSVDRVTDRDELSRLFPGKRAEPGEFVSLSVADDGHGMPQEILNRIFEPYFSTKKRAGTGLGLATVRSIVHELGGAIDVESEVGVGTKMAIIVPIDPAVVECQKDEDAGPVSLPRGRERVLVVDDEHGVRSVLALSLERLGYTVDVAASGAEALEIFAAHPGAIDVVVLDMLMPALPGSEVFVRLRAQRADLPILVISGYVSDSVLRGVLAHGNADFLQKPFTVEDLAHKLRRCLDASPSQKKGKGSR